MKKSYIQPATDFVRTIHGEPLMEKQTLAGSGTAGEMGPTRLRKFIH